MAKGLEKWDKMTFLRSMMLSETEMMHKWAAKHLKLLPETTSQRLKRVKSFGNCPKNLTCTLLVPKSSTQIRSSSARAEYGNLTYLPKRKSGHKSDLTPSHILISWKPPRGYCNAPYVSFSQSVSIRGVMRINRATVYQPIPWFCGNAWSSNDLLGEGVKSGSRSQ